eukprot:CAMPEP_0184480960 /NCGR_PEP_ID=MMETSP0113_2-20130426/2503_1 /TAXON_ID=91329 /ORGANISM="Norrisiella sphaerica, Strain BC52" /LENGTH=313 /DNA_ID=CAMNT_0026859801 /DNA_START=235 /DNA_END=1176 /DNA_ORIENTATION=-
MNVRDSKKCSTKVALGGSGAGGDPAMKWLTENGYEIVGSGGAAGGSGWATTGKLMAKTGEEFFVKQARQPAEAMFRGEAIGLRALYDTKTIRVPKVYHYGDRTDGRDGSFIIMESLKLGGRASMYEFGVDMAKLHLAKPSVKEAAEGMFGFPIDNSCGATPQPNGWVKDWPEFFRIRRIGHQIKLARDSKLSELWKRIQEETDGLKTLFEGIEVKPSTLHGDLWSGNYQSVGGRMAIFDPAVYYGHHEAEWGMSWCAGFGRDFWEGYRTLIPEDPGFKKRAILYEAYHKLNHYNLFGGGYYYDAYGLLESLLD